MTDIFAELTDMLRIATLSAGFGGQLAGRTGRFYPPASFWPYGRSFHQSSIQASSMLYKVRQTKCILLTVHATE